MRLLIRAVACLLLGLLLWGCRKALDPQSNSNQAPETWITAAPQDTVTVKDANGTVVPGSAQGGLIPVRFHIFWAGADRDGAVAGYYWAVTETLATAIAPGFPVPPLPGPKSSDYHWTTRTDSMFTFKTSIDVPDRAHVFYVFAVDDKGRADATPARVYFKAYDRYPPLCIFDQAGAIGTVYIPSGGGVVPQVRTYAVHDSAVVGRSFPTDTVPSSSQLVFRWHGEPTAPGMFATGYRYKLDEPKFNVVDSSVHTVTYNTGVGGDVIVPGVKTFMLQSIGPSGYPGTSTRFFQMNFAPDEWFAGPDLSSPLWTSYVDGGGHRYWYRNVNWTTFATNGGLPGTLLSADSANVLPASRTPRRTFYEIYGDQIWAHQEGDTVNLNSFLVLPTGGSDIDSPYKIHIGTANDIPTGVVTTPGPANGSPVGFRSLVALRRTDNQLLLPSESSTYPVFDFASSFHAPHVLLYANQPLSGEVFVSTVAEDGEGNVDRRITRAGGVVQIVDDVDNGIGVDYSPDSQYMHELAARPTIMHFFVNHAPLLKKDDGAFTPKAGTLSATLQRGTQISFNVLADDIDPLDYTQIVQPGGPQQNVGPVLARTIDIIGKSIYDTTRDTTFNAATALNFQNISFLMPTYFQPGPGTVRITVCDYRPSDAALGYQGRCSAVLEIPITITGPVPADVSTGASQPTAKPGSTPTDGRRQQ